VADVLLSIKRSTELVCDADLNCELIPEDLSLLGTLKVSCFTGECGDGDVTTAPIEPLPVRLFYHNRNQPQLTHI